MKTTLPIKTMASRLVPARSVLALAAGLFGACAVHAAAPPANTLIGNQATARYMDASNIGRNSVSNEVTTTVTQVGSMALTASTEISAGRGTVVYVSHTMTNTGNGPDTFNGRVKSEGAGYQFSKIEVFADADKDGRPDAGTPALCTGNPAAVYCDFSSPSLRENGGTFNFVVAYTVPTTVPVGQRAEASVIMAARDASPAYATYSPKVVTNTDGITVTSEASFRATKSRNAPDFPLPNHKWPITDNPRPSPASCPTTYSSFVSAPTDCNYTVFTIRYTNTGEKPGIFVMSDVLPDGLTYVSNSAYWSSAPSTPLNDAAGAGDDPAGIRFSVTGQTISAYIGTASATPAADWVASKATGTISFIALVNGNARAGTSTTTNIAYYLPGNPADPLNPGTPGTTPTNAVSVPVRASAGVTLGNASATAATGKDGSAGNGDAVDLNVVGSALPGASVMFMQKIFNTGSDDDTFNLEVQADSTFPAGTQFVLLGEDGQSRLLDNDRDPSQRKDIRIALGGQSVVYVQAILPAGATAGGGPFNLTLRATSVNDPAVSDTTRDRLTTIGGVLVDVTNTALGTSAAGSGDIGTGPSQQPTTTLSAAAGTSARFALFIKNNDSVANSYTLEASQTAVFPGNLPAGWTVKFVDAANLCSAAAIDSVSVPVNEQKQIGACVTPPANATVGQTSQVYFRVKSTGNASTGAQVLDIKHDAVTVTAANTFTASLAPDHSGAVTAGGLKTYAHTLTVTGGQSCGAYTLSAASAWSTALFLDVNGDGELDAGDTAVAGPIAGPMAPGDSRNILVRVQSPDGTPDGAVDTVVVTATFDALPGQTETCGAPSARNITTVQSSQINVSKSQRLNALCTAPAADATYGTTQLQAKPGECIDYKVVATNNGAAPVTGMTLHDIVPRFTSYAAAQAAQQCSKSATGVTGDVQFARSGNGLSCGAAAAVNPAASLTMYFSVKVDN